jgi:hypothetical protein
LRVRGPERNCDRQRFRQCCHCHVDLAAGFIQRRFAIASESAKSSLIYL